MQFKKTTGCDCMGNSHSLWVFIVSWMVFGCGKRYSDPSLERWMNLGSLEGPQVVTARTFCHVTHLSSLPYEACSQVCCSDRCRSTSFGPLDCSRETSCQLSAVGQNRPRFSLNLTAWPFRGIAEMNNSYVIINRPNLFTGPKTSYWKVHRV